ncbi:hypothetical protein [Clostridium beijerinckii]|uniref:hypothetical protein n=1 Tax=Clostridium beijerinckii TaxID=1520 RepID=UPI0015707B8E|nr:hypothetical protein [Clostridium beijerinckii]NRT72550.1 hypothetical protein [Clostridium beijerinckii]
MFDISPYRTMMRALEKATAYRRDGIIYIFVTGEMPTPCDEVKIVGTYPGNIVHIKDPGVAELFIKMGRKSEEEGEYCIPIVMPFFIEEEIEDSNHDEVAIYVNDNLYKRIEIEEWNETFARGRKE